MSVTDWNWEFSFSKSGCHIPVKVLIVPYYLFYVGARIVGTNHTFLNGISAMGDVISLIDNLNSGFNAPKDEIRFPPVELNNSSPKGHSRDFYRVNSKRDNRLRWRIQLESYRRPWNLVWSDTFVALSWDLNSGFNAPKDEIRFPPVELNNSSPKGHSRDFYRVNSKRDNRLRWRIQLESYRRPWNLVWSDTFVALSWDLNSGFNAPKDEIRFPPVELNNSSPKGHSRDFYRVNSKIYRRK